MRGSIRPRQLGPWMRSRCGRAASSIARLSSSRMPAVMTTAARVPLAPSSAMSAGERGGRRDDDGEIRCGRKCGHGRVAVVALDRAVLRVDEPDRPGKPAGQQVARRDQPDAAGPRAGTDQRHRARLQQELKVADRHDGSPSIRDDAHARPALIPVKVVRLAAGVWPALTEDEGREMDFRAFAPPAARARAVARSPAGVGNKPARAHVL